MSNIIERDAGRALIACAAAESITSEAITETIKIDTRFMAYFLRQIGMDIDVASQ